MNKHLSVESAAHPSWKEHTGPTHTRSSLCRFIALILIDLLG